MRLIDRARRIFGIGTVSAEAPRATVATSVRATANSADTPANARYWRTIANGGERNLRDLDHKQMVTESIKAAQVDPIAKAHVRLVRSITVGAQEVGPEIRCADEESRKRLQALLDSFWFDPRNRVGANLGVWMDGVTTTGSLALTLTTGEASNVTRIGYLDPEGYVAPGILTDPANVLEPIALLRAGWTSDETIAHPIVQADGSMAKVMEGKAEGSTLSVPRSDRYGGPLKVRVGAPCMYLGVNNCVPNQTIGISDLYASLDLMRVLDELIFGAIERSVNIGAYSLHVKFPRGTSQADMDARMQTIRADIESGKGRAVGTTDDVSITAVYAALQSGEWATLEKMARANTLIGLGPWPIHVFSDGGATNVATAAEQGSPVANFLLDRQNAFRRFILDMCWYALRRYPEARALLEENEDADIHLSLPVIVAKDTTRESNVLAVETNSLTAARDAGFITTEAAQREWRDAACRYGFHFDPEDAPDAEDVDEERNRTISLPPIQTMPEEPEEVETPTDREMDPGQTTSEGTPASAEASVAPVIAVKARRRRGKKA